MIFNGGIQRREIKARCEVNIRSFLRCNIGFIANNQSLKAAQKHAIAREKVSARLKTAVVRKACLEPRRMGQAGDKASKV